MLVALLVVLNSVPGLGSALVATQGQLAWHSRRRSSRWYVLQLSSPILVPHSLASLNRSQLCILLPACLVYTLSWPVSFSSGMPVPESTLGKAPSYKDMLLPLSTSSYNGDRLHVRDEASTVRALGGALLQASQFSPKR